MSKQYVKAFKETIKKFNEAWEKTLDIKYLYAKAKYLEGANDDIRMGEERGGFLKSAMNENKLEPFNCLVSSLKSTRASPNITVDGLIDKLSNYKPHLKPSAKEPLAITFSNFIKTVEGQRKAYLLANIYGVLHFPHWRKPKWLFREIQNVLPEKKRAAAAELFTKENIEKIDTAISRGELKHFGTNTEVLWSLINYPKSSSAFSDYLK